MRDKIGLLWEAVVAAVYLSALVVIVLSIALGVCEAITPATPGR
jgi:hypothetical protein